MNEMILKEKFIIDHGCLDIDNSANVNKCDTNSGGTDSIIAGLDELFNKCNNANPEEKKVAMECAGDNSNKDVCCDKGDNIADYCTYLNSIKRLLWGTCLTCDKKKAIIDAVKRSKCDYTQPVPPASPPQDDTPPEAGGGGGGGGGGV